MIKFSLLTTLLIVSLSGISQLDPLGQYNQNIAANWKGEYIRIGPYKVKGSPFLFDQSFTGSIKYFGGKSATNVKVLYDLYNQKAGVEEVSKKEIFTASEPIEEFLITLPASLGGQALLFRNGVSFGNAEQPVYYNVLQDGTITFLKLFKIKLIPDPSSMLDKEVKIFEQYAEYYLYSKKSNKLQKIKLRQKDVANFIGDEHFIKMQMQGTGVDYSKEADISKLIYSYNNR